MSHNSIKPVTGIKEGVTATTGLAWFFCAKQAPNFGQNENKIPQPAELHREDKCRQK